MTVEIPVSWIPTSGVGDAIGIGIMGLLLLLSWGVTIWGGSALFDPNCDEKGLCAITTIFSVVLSVGLSCLFLPAMGLIRFT
jgi:hypothetical protein